MTSNSTEEGSNVQMKNLQFSHLPRPSLNTRASRARRCLALTSLLAVLSSACGEDAIGPEPASELGQTRQPLASCGIGQEDRLASGYSMHSDVDYDATTEVATVTTTLTNSRSLSGFTGGVMLAFVDEFGRPLFLSQVQRFGLGACGFRCPRKRTVTWSVEVPTRLTASIQGIAILQDPTPTHRVLFESLDIGEALVEACAAASLGTDIACDLGAIGIAQLSGLLSQYTNAQLQAAIADMIDSIPQRIQGC
jgi:hypothetical protein